MLGMCKYEQLLRGAKLPEGGPAAGCCDRENTSIEAATALGFLFDLGQAVPSLRPHPGKLRVGVSPARTAGCGKCASPHASAAAC